MDLGTLNFARSRHRLRVVRTRDELIGEVMAELRFERRGKNIVAAITAAIDRALGMT
jgi:hypothetical protein